jgi:dimethylhistidine N-methyltransferase
MSATGEAVARRAVLYDLRPAMAAFRDEIVAGLRLPQKVIAAKFFYDKRGSELFDAICELDEYYPTRTEIGLLKRYAGEIAAAVGERTLLIEYGSGSGVKIRLLLDAMKRPAAYMPVDISREHLRDATRALASVYPNLPIVAVCADYSKPFPPPIEGIEHRGKAIFFPGSTIGNFTPAEALGFLKNAAELLGKGGGLVIGVDLKKDAGILHAAYNDAKGVTADFNLNLLVRINAELGADFDIAGFRHEAFYAAAAGRIEMHLVSLRDQTARIGAETFHFRADETIHTENSYKYSIAEFQALARRAGFAPVKAWTDEGELFSVHLLRVAP